MRPAAEEAFPDFSTHLEGWLGHPYLDVKGLVTVGVGFLAEPIERAQAMPFVHPDGTPATSGEIAYDWRKVKFSGMTGHPAADFARLTTLRLTRDGVRQVMARLLRDQERILRARFPGWDDFPADAQLGIASMSWAMGPEFHFPKFQAFVNASPPVWAVYETADDGTLRITGGAALECLMNTVGNPGIVPRNTANQRLFLNAQLAADRALSPECLYYPDEAMEAA